MPVPKLQARLNVLNPHEVLEGDFERAVETKPQRDVLRDSSKSLAFVHETGASWIIQDLALLRRFTEVEDVAYKNVLHASRIFKAVHRASCVIVWGAAGQAFFIAVLLGILFRKHVIVLVNGSEVSPFQTRAYSNLRSSARFAVSRRLFSFADVIVLPSPFSQKELESQTRPRRTEILFHGVDTEYFAPSQDVKRLIVTVSSSDSTRKGVDRFIQLAKLLPHRQFALVGRACYEPSVRSNCPSNVELVGEVSRDGLLKVYRNTRYYCQLSRHEGFGVAVAEAMACGCVPVVSDSGALPWIVGDCGYIIRGGEPSKVAEALEANWNNERGLASLAAARVRANFSLMRRADQLRRIVSNTIGNSVDHLSNDAGRIVRITRELTREDTLRLRSEGPNWT